MLRSQLSDVKRAITTWYQTRVNADPELSFVQRVTKPKRQNSRSQSRSTRSTRSTFNRQRSLSRRRRSISRRLSQSSRPRPSRFHSLALDRLDTEELALVLGGGRSTLFQEDRMEKLIAEQHLIKKYLQRSEYLVVDDPSSQNDLIQIFVTRTLRLRVYLVGSMSVMATGIWVMQWVIEAASPNNVSFSPQTHVVLHCIMIPLIGLLYYTTYVLYKSEQSFIEHRSDVAEMMEKRFWNMDAHEVSELAYQSSNHVQLLTLLPSTLLLLGALFLVDRNLPILLFEFVFIPIIFSVSSLWIRMDVLPFQALGLVLGNAIIAAMLVIFFKQGDFSTFELIASVIAFILTGGCVSVLIYRHIYIMMSTWHHNMQLKCSLYLEQKEHRRIMNTLMPKSISEELLTQGKLPFFRSNATIAFIKIDSLDTHHKKVQNVTQLVKHLHHVISAIDRSLRQWDEVVVKIEHVANYVLLASNIIPFRKKLSHGEAMIRAVMEIYDELTLMNEKFHVQARLTVGVHTGNIIGTVIGTSRKFFRIFGDPVNTTSRVCSTGEVGHLNVSQAVFELPRVRETFLFHDRGEVSMKGKGEMRVFIATGFAPRLKQISNEQYRTQYQLNLLHRSDSILGMQFFKLFNDPAALANRYTLLFPYKPDPQASSYLSQPEPSIMQAEAASPSSAATTKGTETTAEKSLLKNLEPRFVQHQFTIKDREGGQFALHIVLCCAILMLGACDAAVFCLHLEEKGELHASWLGMYAGRLAQDIVIACLSLVPILLTRYYRAQENPPENDVAFVLIHLLIGLHIQWSGVIHFHDILAHTPYRPYAGVAFEVVTFFGINLRFFNAICIVILIDVPHIFWNFAFHGWEAGSLALFFNVSTLVIGAIHKYQLEIESRQHLIFDLAIQKSRAERIDSTKLLLPSFIVNRVIENTQKGFNLISRSFRNATVYQSDIMGFTSICSRLRPVQVVAFLDDLYQAYDQLCADRGIFKIETIGDAYICVNFQGPSDPILFFALDVIDLHRNKFKKYKFGGFETDVMSVSVSDTEIIVDDVNVRIGIAHGELLGSVLGISGLRFHVFGRALDEAIQLEGKCSANKILVTQGVKDVSESLWLKYEHDEELDAYWLSDSVRNTVRDVMQLSWKDRRDREVSSFSSREVVVGSELLVDSSKRSNRSVNVSFLHDDPDPPVSRPVQLAPVSNAFSSDASGRESDPDSEDFTSEHQLIAFADS